MSVILGIDPGSRITGYGVIKEQHNQLTYLDSGCIRTGDGSLSERLLAIFTGICTLLERYMPDEFAIEEVFMHQNASAALKLGHARGVAMVAAASHRIAVSEYSAREIKKTIVGNGGAEKDQVKHMVIKLLDLNKAPQSDAADALAIAISHAHMRNKFLFTSKSKKSSRRSV